MTTRQRIPQGRAILHMALGHAAPVLGVSADGHRSFSAMIGPANFHRDPNALKEIDRRVGDPPSGQARASLDSQGRRVVVVELEKAP